MTMLDETREKIIEAARERFTHYGYGKTTMAELARDCDMSSGNLYRFFPGKLDIAEEICRRASIQTADELNLILTCPERDACAAEGFPVSGPAGNLCSAGKKSAHCRTGADYYR